MEILNLLKGGGYQFIPWSDMPRGAYEERRLDYSNMNIVTTTDLKYGRNHCGAVAVANIILYFASQGKTNLLENNSEYESLVKAHQLIGNGPVVRIEKGASRYFKFKGYDLKFNNLNSFEDIKACIERANPFTLLLSSALLDWHWVVGVGWREYENGDKYIEIIDGWNRHYSYFYQVKIRKDWILAMEYYLG